MSYGSLFISGAALIVSMISLYFARKSWLESNRPIITARVTTHLSGNEGVALNILVENTGSRPAKNVKLSVSKEILSSSLIVQNEEKKKGIENCFGERGVIPILANGKSVSNSFGFLKRRSEQEDWKIDSRFDITVDYEDLNGRKYNHIVPILVAEDSGFAGGYWSSSIDSKP